MVEYPVGSPGVNHKNAAFYGGFAKGDLMQLAQAGGLADCVDVKQVDYLLAKARSVLEVGAGYGRVVNYLLSHYSSLKVSAIERDPRYFRRLCSAFAHQAQIIKGDILSYQSNHKYDLIMWMWAGICEFFM